MINIDYNRLARLWGHKIDDAFNDDLERMAARVITDSMESPSAEIAMINAKVWLKRAYAEGFVEGERKERQRWVKNLSLMFGFDKKDGYDRS